MSKTTNQTFCIPTRIIGKTVVPSSRYLIPIRTLDRAGERYYQFDIATGGYTALKTWNEKHLKEINPQMTNTKVPTPNQEVPLSESTSPVDSPDTTPLTPDKTDLLNQKEWGHLNTLANTLAADLAEGIDQDLAGWRNIPQMAEDTQHNLIDWGVIESSASQDNGARYRITDLGRKVINYNQDNPVGRIVAIKLKEGKYTAGEIIKVSDFDQSRIQILTPDDKTKWYDNPQIITSAPATETAYIEAMQLAFEARTFRQEKAKLAAQRKQEQEALENRNQQLKKALAFFGIEAEPEDGRYIINGYTFEIVGSAIAPGYTFTLRVSASVDKQAIRDRKPPMSDERFQSLLGIKGTVVTVDKHFPYYLPAASDNDTGKFYAMFNAIKSAVKERVVRICGDIDIYLNETTPEQEPAAKTAQTPVKIVRWYATDANTRKPEEEIADLEDDGYIFQGIAATEGEYSALYIKPKAHPNGKERITVVETEPEEPDIWDEAIAAMPEEVGYMNEMTTTLNVARDVLFRNPQISDAEMQVFRKAVTAIKMLTEKSISNNTPPAVSIQAVAS